MTSLQEDGPVGSQKGLDKALYPSQPRSSADSAGTWHHPANQLVENSASPQSLNISYSEILEKGSKPPHVPPSAKTDEGQIPHPKSCIAIGVLSGCIFGYNCGVISGLSKGLVSQFFPKATASRLSTYSGVLTSCILVLSWVGALISPSLLKRFALNSVMSASGFWCLICGIGMALTSYFSVLLIFRSLMGLSVGTMAVCGPLFVGLMAPQRSKGAYGCIFQISVCLFIFIAQLTNYLLNRQNELIIANWKWRLEFALGAIPGLILMIVALYLPIPKIPTHSSPVTTTRNTTKVEDSSSHPTAPRNEWKNLFKTSQWRSWLLAFLLASANQLSGINVVIFYAPSIFEQAGLANSLLLTLFLVGLWNLITVLINFLLVDRIGRRKLMLIGLFGMSLGFLMLILAYTVIPEKALGPIAIMAILIVLACYESGPGPLFYLLATEAFPRDIKHVCLSLINQLGWLMNILVSMEFPVLNDEIGPAATFSIFGGASFLTGVGLYFHLHETKIVEEDVVTPDPPIEQIASEIPVQTIPALAGFVYHPELLPKPLEHPDHSKPTDWDDGLHHKYSQHLKKNSTEKRERGNSESMDLGWGRDIDSISNYEDFTAINLNHQDYGHLPNYQRRKSSIPSQIIDSIKSDQ